MNKDIENKGDNRDMRSVHITIITFIFNILIHHIMAATHDNIRPNTCSRLHYFFRHFNGFYM